VKRREIGHGPEKERGVSALRGKENSSEYDGKGKELLVIEEGVTARRQRARIDGAELSRCLSEGGERKQGEE